MRHKIYNLLRWGLVALLFVVIYQTIRIGWASWSVYQDVTTLRQQLSDDVGLNQTAQPESQIEILSEHLIELHNQVQPIAFLLEHLDWIPFSGSTILPIISSGIQLIPQATQLLGLEEPQTYLVLLQNNHELRATGGFIASVGEAMQRYMDIETMYLRDANWSPHLPTTARLVRDLYFLHTGVEAKGVITADLHAVTLLVESAEWWVSRKDFIPLFAEGAVAAARAKGIANIALAQAMQEALNRRFIQIWIDEPHVRTELAELGWDGALHPARNADYLALVDSNLGFNKADAVLQRTLDYAVDWPDQASV